MDHGRSHNIEVAVEEGATLVRVGAAIFGPRIPSAPTSHRPPASLQHPERERGANKVNKTNEFDGPSLQHPERENV